MVSAASIPMDTTIDAVGVANDDDWYELTVSAGNTTLYAAVSFTDDIADIDIELYDEDGDELDSSAGTSDTESITLTDATPGTYYLRVFLYNDDEGPADYQVYWENY